MQKRLFLTGPSGCGKSTMIRSALGEGFSRAGGFVTVRDRDPAGVIRGFDLMAADGSSLPQRFLDFTGPKPRIRLEVFSGPGARVLDRAGEYPYAVVDEIGGVELLDHEFMGALARFLSGGTPCIGVMKGEGPAGKLVELMGLTLRYELARQALYRRLEADPDTLILKTTGLGDLRACRMVERWAEAYAGPGSAPIL